MKHKTYRNLTPFGVQKFKISDFINKFNKGLVNLDKAVKSADLKQSEYQKWLDSVIIGATA